MTNVLIIEDNPADARLIREMLSGGAMPGVRLDHATSLAAGLAILAKQAPDAVLLDLGLPDSQGMDTFIAAHSNAPNVPIVVLTGFSDEAVGSRTVEAGAQDYLVKGQVDAHGLVRAIEYAVRRHAQREELELIASELERRNAELSAFTYSVSHDLKEPLRTIEAFSQFVMEDYANALDEQGRDYLTRMGAAAARLKQMIEDLLLLSRTGQRPETVERVELSEVLNDIVAALDGSIRAKGGRVDIAPALPAVLGDRARVEQIFGNLISNALKFGREEPPCVEIGVTAGDDGGTFFVRDNGIGIDPRYSERIFQVFQRLHRREEYEGTGAGLAIVKRAAEALGGRVWLNSTLGKGSTFFVSLPLFDASHTRERVEEAA
jgi:light-regulated signal transduction histidine kinase (bacteriophytochrome)